MKQLLLAGMAIILSLNLKAQLVKTRYAIETTFNDKTPVAYEENYGALKLNSATSDLIFITNLAELRTGNTRVDSLLADREQMTLTFQANLGQGLFGLIKEENDDTYHKLTGTIMVNNISYPAEAYVRLENLADKSSMSKALLDLKLQIDPKIVLIPFLSDFFNNILLFQVNDGIVNQNL